MGMEEIEQVKGTWNIDNVQLSKRPKVLYHATRLDNVDKILKEGLKVNAPQSLVNKEIFNRKGVYLTTEMFGWMYWVTDDHTYRGAIISVDTEGLELIEDSDLIVFSGMEESDRNLMDYICLHDIPAENIIAVSREQPDGGFVEMKMRVRGEFNEER